MRQAGGQLRLLIFPLVAAPADAIISLCQLLQDFVRSVGRGIVEDEHAIQSQMKVVTNSGRDDIRFRPHQRHPEDLHARVNGATEFRRLQVTSRAPLASLRCA